MRCTVAACPRYMRCSHPACILPAWVEGLKPGSPNTEASVRVQRLLSVTIQLDHEWQKRGNIYSAVSTFSVWRPLKPPLGMLT